MKIEKNNKGLAFLNKYAESDKHPKYKGSCKVNNEDYDVAIWISTSKKTGDKYLSLQFTTEEEAKKYKKEEEESATLDPDELPF